MICRHAALINTSMIADWLNHHVTCSRFYMKHWLILERPGFPKRTPIPLFMLQTSPKVDNIFIECSTNPRSKARILLNPGLKSLKKKKKLMISLTNRTRPRFRPILKLVRLTSFLRIRGKCVLVCGQQVLMFKSITCDV